jgi:hypothetical protein
MPAVSKAQRRLAALVLKNQAQTDAFKGMDKEELRKFASTPEKGLPSRKGKNDFEPLSLPECYARFNDAYVNTYGEGVHDEETHLNLQYNFRDPGGRITDTGEDLLHAED